MRKSCLIFLAFFLLHALAAGNIRIANYYLSDPENAVLYSFQRNNLTYVNAARFAEVLRLKSDFSKRNARFTLEVSGKKLEFSRDNHFVVTDDGLYNLPVPALYINEQIFIPLETVIERFSGLFPADFLFAGDELIYHRKDLNIIKLNSSIELDRTFIDLITSRQLDFYYRTGGPGQAVLEIPGGRIEKKISREKSLPPEVKSLEINRNADETGLILTFATAGNAELDTIYYQPGISAIRMVFKGGSFVSEELKKSLDKVKERWRFDTVVIDPGHGGKDPGAVGPSGVYEKNVVLDIALRVEKLLQKNSDIKPVLTRNKDVFVPLYERGKIANKAQGKLFVSIHCNASKDRRARGFQTFFLSPAKNQQAVDAAMLENAAIEYEEDKTLYADLTDENYILMSMTQSNNVRMSETVGSIAQEKLSKQTDLKNRGVDQAGFYVLYGANMPAILVETAFISNKNEEKLLRSKKFRQSVAQAIFDCIIKFSLEIDKEL